MEDVSSGLELTDPETLVGGRKVEAGCFVEVSLQGRWKATPQVEGAEGLLPAALWVMEVVEKVRKVE